MVALELKTQVYPVAAQMLVLIPGGDSGEPLVERIAVAGQAEKEGILLHRETERARPAPSLLGIVDEFGQRGIDVSTRRFDVEFRQDIIRNVAAHDVRTHLARRIILL